MLSLALYNDNGPFTAAPAVDVTWKNGVDSSGNRLSVAINLQNRYISRSLLLTVAYTLNNILG